MAVLSRKLQQLDEEREKCSDKIKNTEIRLEQVSQGVDESERSVTPVATFCLILTLPLATSGTQNSEDAVTQGDDGQ